MRVDELTGMGIPLLGENRLRGVLKSRPEDFIVEEIPSDIPEEMDGRYTIFSAVLKNWDTNRFVSYLARRLGISKERIRYAGTKDKRGITKQFFSIDGDFDLSNMMIHDATIDRVFRSNTRLELGMLMGNRFIVGLGEGIDRGKVLNSLEKLDSIGGFPNYFGQQRFGSIRVNTHRIGELLVRGKYEDAVLLYLYDPVFDHDYFRINFHETGDARAALKEYPLHLNFERSLLGYIAEKGKIDGAFDVFPRNLRMLFIHAYQSYLFNRILAKRIRTVGSLNEILEGDTVVEVDNLFNKSGKEIVVNSFNIGQIRALVAEDRMRPVAKLFGYKTTFSDGIMGEIEREVLGDIRQDNFKITGHRDMWSSGDTRITSSRARDFRVTEDGSFAFSLGRGMYATVFLREIFDFD
jgi:tRNA pseudouridine13 synthase